MKALKVATYTLGVGLVVTLSQMIAPYVSTALAGNATLDSHPSVIRIADDHKGSVELSKKGINRIFVVKDPITSVVSPNHRLVSHNDTSGSVFLTVMGDSPFVAYFATQKGRHFSLRVEPTSSDGQTVRIVPKTPISSDHVQSGSDARRFEASSPYEKTLLELSKSLMDGNIPAGYREVPKVDFGKMLITRVIKHPKKMHGLSVTLTHVFVGGDLALQVSTLKNHTKKTMWLSEKSFYRTGVRAIVLPIHRLGPKESTTLYEVVNHA